MQNNTPSSLKFVEKTESDILDILLHGGAGGMNQSLMPKIFEACVGLGHSVANFNFPFFERGDEHSSGPELEEEITTVKNVLEHCKFDRYKHVRLIGKSLGGIIIGKFLSKIDVSEQSKYSVVIFGYVTGDIDLRSFNSKISIIQGEKDKYGNTAVVKNDMSDAVSSDISYYEIANGDHSYRNEEKEPVYEDDAINLFIKL